MARPIARDANGRERLLAAAARLLLSGEGKVGSLSVARVCKEAGCTAPTLYHHFPDLSALVAAAGRRAFDDWAGAIEVGLGDEPDPRRRLTLRGQAYVEWAIQHQAAYRAMFPRFASSATPVQGPGPAFAALRTDVAAALGTTPGDPRVLTLALAHWAAVHGLATLAMATSPIPPAAWEAALDHLTAALGARLDEFAEHLETERSAVVP
ncbi:MAG: TetR/AcrR family transcriptional regulator [Propionicimonas sp.]